MSSNIDDMSCNSIQCIGNLFKLSSDSLVALDMEFKILSSKFNDFLLHLKCSN